METKGSYGELVCIRSECLIERKNWIEPTSNEVRAALKMAGWSGEELSRRIGVDSRTVRRWTLGEKPINYASWCVLCVQAGFGEIWMFASLEDPKSSADN
ncbi:helix-turn-helix domain-containing protein [Pseudomonas helleri]|uniref:helix-turn-helix domain-containing protein n=1 Tax=Pseudomonas helleri TaxID=1608996 RepID=UPI003FD05A11